MSPGCYNETDLELNVIQGWQDGLPLNLTFRIQSVGLIGSCREPDSHKLYSNLHVPAREHMWHPELVVSTAYWQWNSAQTTKRLHTFRLIEYRAWLTSELLTKHGRMYAKQVAQRTLENICPCFSPAIRSIMAWRGVSSFMFFFFFLDFPGISANRTLRPEQSKKEMKLTRIIKIQ